jgi:hypothetical protein
MRTRRRQRYVNGLIVACCVFLLGTGNALAIPVRSVAVMANQEENTRPVTAEEENEKPVELNSASRTSRRTRRRKSRPPACPSADPAGACLPLPLEPTSFPSPAPAGINCARGNCINPALRL